MMMMMTFTALEHTRRPEGRARDSMPSLWRVVRDILLAPVSILVYSFNIGRNLSKKAKLTLSSGAKAEENTGTAAGHPALADIDDLLKQAEKAAAEDKRPSRPRANLGAGGSTHNYSWTQTSDDVEVRISPLLCRAARTRDVSVRFGSDALAVEIGGEVILDGAPCRALAPDGCSWQFDDDGAGGERCLLLTLAKKVPTPVVPERKCTHWDCVLQGDDAVDVTHIGAENYAIYQQARKDAAKKEFEEKTGLNCEVAMS